MDVIIERRKRCGIVVILLSTINTRVSFLSSALKDTESKTDENAQLLSFHANVLHPLLHYHFPMELFRTYF